MTWAAMLGGKTSRVRCQIYQVTHDDIIALHHLVTSYLTGSFVGAHLKADCGMVHRCLDTVLWVIQMPSCSISSHSRLAGTLIGTHLYERDIH